MKDLNENNKLGDKNVGDIVKIRENGTLTNYIVVQKGKPSDSYDESCDGVWLLRQDINTTESWDGSAGFGYDNDYENSEINTWLNSTFLNTIDETIRNEIKTVKIPFIKGLGDESTGVQSGTDGLSCKAFLLSGYEVGFTKSDNSRLPIDGAKLDYFSDNASRIAKLKGSALSWWLRSPHTYWDTYWWGCAWYVRTNGSSSSSETRDSRGMRPAFIMPFDTSLNNDDEIIVDYIHKPYLETSLFDYSAKEIFPTIKNFYKDTMTKSGTLSGVTAGEYEIYISLNDPEHYTWEDGTTDDVVLKWTINPITIPKPTLAETSFEYEGKNYNKSITINNYNADLMTKSGIETANKAGKYSVVLSLKDTDSSSWDNGDGTTSVEDVVLEWEITKITVDIPYLSEDEFTYNGNYISPVVNNVNSKVMDWSGTFGAQYAGKYSITYFLYDTDSTTWSDGTIDNKILYWKINKQVQTVKIPYLDPTEFTYDGTRKSPTIINDCYEIIVSGTTSSINACGDDPFVINIELRQESNYLYQWEDGTTDDIVLTWRVNKAILDIPTIDTSEFNYDGTTKTAPVSSYSTAIVNRTGTVSAKSAGDYSVTYSIIDKNSAEWADGTTDDKTVTWKINKSVFTIPTAINTSLVVNPKDVSYDSSVYLQTLELENYDTNVMSISGNTAYYPGIYTATIALCDVNSASWEDGTTENKTIEWEILKKEYFVKKPSLANDTFQFNGLTHSVTINDLSSSVMTISSETSGKIARKYNAIAELRDSNIYDFKWEDGTTDNVVMPWEIEKSSFEKPTLSNYNFDYDGLNKSVTVNGYNSDIMEYNSNNVYNATAAGKYLIVISLKDKLSSSWSDGSTNDVILSWIINKTTFDIPTVTDIEFTYDGNYKRPTVSGFNLNVMTDSGFSAKNAGNYTIIFTLKDANSASWKDGTTEQKKFNWKINKAIMQIDKPYLSDDEFTYNGYTFAYYTTSSTHSTSTSRGLVSAYIQKFNSTYSSVSGTTITSSAGDYSIVITLKDTTNYIAQWSDGTTDPLDLKWKVNKAVFNIPTLSSTHFNYGGKTDTYCGYRYALISGFNAWVMTSNAVTGHRSPNGSWNSTAATYYENSTFYTPSQWQIGKYYARFGFKDPASATWSDGTNGEIVIEWSISREVVLLQRPYLQATSFEYDGTEKEPVISNDTGEGIIYTGNLKKTEVGNYSIVAKLYRRFEVKDTRDYRWDDNTVDDIIVMNWNIWSDGVLAAPDVAPLEFTYDGKKHEPVIYGFDENTMTKSGDFSATSMGEYKITFSLKHPNSITWSDGSTEDKVFTWNINKGIAYSPYLSPTDLMYDGNCHNVTTIEDTTGNSYVLYQFDNNTMKYSGDTSVIPAGDYSISVALKDKASCDWADGTSDDITIPFTVSKKVVLLDKPSLETDEFVFDNTQKTPEILMWAKTGLYKSGDISATKAGNYKIKIFLADDNNITYLWADHSSDPIELSWKIKGRNGLKKPEVTSLDFLYDSLEHSPEIFDYENNLISISGTTSQINAGNYKIIFSLKDKSSCTWADGTTSNYVVSWVIRNAEIGKPILKQSEFDYNGTVHTLEFDGFDNKTMTKSGTDSAISAGDYNVTIAPDKNYCWIDGTSDTLSFDWRINKTLLKIPILKQSEFDYDGTKHTLEFDGFDPLIMTKTETHSAVAAGDYIAKIALTDDTSSEWITKTKTADISDKEYGWQINKSVFNIPTVIDLTFQYDGNIHAPTITGFDENVMNISGNSPTKNSGEYTVIISLKDINSASWSDGTTENKSTKWVINKTHYSKPCLTNTEFTYNGGIHEPTVKGLDVNSMYVSGEESGIGAGIYHVLICFKDPNNSCWDDGSSEPLSLEWIIHGKPINKPYLEKSIFEYEGKEISPNILGFKSAAMNKSGDLSATNIGNYKITITLTNNYEWLDGGFEPYELIWIIKEAIVKIPIVNDIEFDYDKTVHAPKISNLDLNKVKINGDTSATCAGTYKIIFSLADKSHAFWEDNTSDDIEVEWKINKHLLTKPIGETLSFIYNGGSNRPVINNPNISIYVSKTVPDNINNYELLYYGEINKINAGSYSVTYEIVDKSNYSWEDGTNDNVTINWVIEQKPIPKPYLDPDTFQYNGHTKKPDVIGFVKAAMFYADGNEYSAVEIGNYSITICLWKKNYNYGNVYNYKWDDGDPSYTLTLKWEITKGELDYPNLLQDEYTYNGSSISPKINNYISSSMQIIGDRYAIDAGDYNIGFVITDTDKFVWKSGIIDGQLIPWKINKAKLLKSKLPYLDENLVYNAHEQTPSWIDYDIRKLNIGGTNRAINVGEYYTEFSPTKNYIWDDGTTTPVKVAWKITELGIITPKQCNALYYDTTVQEPEWLTTYNLKNIIYTGETSGINANEYFVNCQCDNNCYFIDTGTTNCATSWVINKRQLYSISAEYKKYKYTGNEIEPIFLNYYPEYLNISGDYKATDIGSYTAVFSIKDTKNCMWAKSVIPNKNGTVSANWDIVLPTSATKLNIPYQYNSLVYNGESQNPIFRNYNTDLMILEGGIPSKTDAGTYYVTFSLKYNENYTWSDGTTEDKVVKWVIRPRRVPFPYILTDESDGNGMYYYELEGKRYPVWKKYKTEIMTISGDIYDTDNSWHTTYFELKDKKNYIWISNNDAYEKYPVSWILSKAYPNNLSVKNGKKVHIPKQSNHPIEDGTTKYPKWDSYDNTAIINIGGEWEGIDAGERFVILELQPGYVWEDDSDEIKGIPWEIFTKSSSSIDSDKTLLHIPKQIDPPYYDGYVKYPEWDLWSDYGFDVVKGTLMEVPAGRYKILLRLKTGYVWEDSTTEDKTVYWYIQPRDLEKEYPDEPETSDDTPKTPDPETEEILEETNGGCCACCCDTGLFDKLNDSYQDDNYECSCQDNS